MFESGEQTSIYIRSLARTWGARALLLSSLLLMPAAGLRGDDKVWLMREFLAEIYPEWRYKGPPAPVVDFRALPPGDTSGLFKEQTNIANRMTVITLVPMQGKWPLVKFSVVLEHFNPPGLFSAHTGRTTPCQTETAKYGSGKVVSDNPCEIFPKQTSQPLVQAMFTFGRRDGGLSSFVGSLMAVQDKNVAFKETVKAHPEWTDEEVIQALKQAGARYGPWANENFLKVIPYEGLKRVVGKGKLVSAEVRGCFRGFPSQACSPALYWQVAMEKPRKGGVSTCFGMTFEPFEGKLTTLAEVPPGNDEEAWRSFGCPPRNKPAH